MKRLLSVIVSLTLVISAGTAGVFAAENAPAFSDTVGTAYEKPAEYLAGKQILSGFPDGTFQPEHTITRAQACTMTAKLLNASDSELTAAA